MTIFYTQTHSARHGKKQRILQAVKSPLATLKNQRRSDKAIVTSPMHGNAAINKPSLDFYLPDLMTDGDDGLQAELDKVMAGIKATTTCKVAKQHIALERSVFPPLAELNNSLGKDPTAGHNVKGRPTSADVKFIKANEDVSTSRQPKRMSSDPKTSKSFCKTYRSGFKTTTLAKKEERALEQLKEESPKQLKATNRQQSEDSESTTGLLVFRARRRASRSGGNGEEKKRLTGTSTLANDNDMGVALPQSLSPITPNDATQGSGYHMSSNPCTVRGSAKSSPDKAGSPSATDPVDESPQTAQSSKTSLSQSQQSLKGKVKRLEYEVEGLQKDVFNQCQQRNTILASMQTQRERTAELTGDLENAVTSNAQMSHAMTADKLQSEFFQAKLLTLQAACNDELPVAYETQNLIDTKESTIAELREELEQVRTAWNNETRKARLDMMAAQSCIQTLEREHEADCKRANESEQRVMLFELEVMRMKQLALSYHDLSHPDVVGALDRTSSLEMEVVSLKEKNLIQRHESSRSITAKEQELLTERQEHLTLRNRFNAQEEELEQRRREYARVEFNAEALETEAETLRNDLEEARQQPQQQRLQLEQRVFKLEGQVLEGSSSTRSSKAGRRGSTVKTQRSSSSASSSWKCRSGRISGLVRRCSTIRSVI